MESKQKIRLKSLGQTGTKFNRRKNRQYPTTNITEPRQSLNEQQKAEVIAKMKNIQKNRFKNSFQELITHSQYHSLQESDLSAQQWQNKKEQQTPRKLDLISYENYIDMVFSSVTMLCYAFTVWLGTVEFFFGSNKVFFIPRLFFIGPIVLLIIDSLLNGTVRNIANATKFKTKLKHAYKPTFCLLYFLLKILSLGVSSQIYWLLLELPCLFHLFSRASQFYQSFRVMTLSKKYEYHIKSFDLIFSLALLAHIIAIILFQITLIEGFTNTWRSNLKIEGNNPLIFYIYSFYFGCTTILTVGYGDIVPANHYQIAVVCLIELFGIAIFAYLISEIGYNLSNLRKDRQVVEKDLSVLQKCRQYYKIQPEIITKARLNLLNSQQAVNRLKPEEENQLILKLSQPLRQEVVSNNNLSILKSSIFFLCRWSKHFQINLAKNLVSALYMPGQHFIQPEKKERIYIIRLGKVQFYKKQKESKRESQKVIRTLKVDLKTQVSNNSFGYTDVIGGKPTDLQAVSSDFTSAYYISKDKFLNCFNEKSTDYEYYHEVKDKIEQSRIPEALELPVLSSRKYHYSPLRACLIKRQGIKNKGLQNNRVQLIRNEMRKGKKQMVVSSVANPKGVDKVQKAYITSMDEITLREEMEREKETKLSIDSGFMGLYQNEYKGTLAKSLEYETIKYFLVRQKDLDEKFKEYTNYYPSHNLQLILKKYDNKIIAGERPQMFSMKEVVRTVKEKFMKEI